MKIGFLHAGFPPKSLLKEYGDYLGMFAAAFAQHAPEIELADFRVQKGAFPTSVEEYDGYLCCGSAHSSYDADPWIKELGAFIREVNATGGKMAGICFGHQMIARSLGGEVVRAPQGWGLGVKSVDTVLRLPWMDPALNRFNLLYTHQDQVTELPPGALWLGGNAHCPIAAFELEGRFLGIQGHPEFEVPYLDALMTSREKRIGRKVVAQARTTLEQEIHNAQVMRWIGNFLTTG